MSEWYVDIMSRAENFLSHPVTVNAGMANQTTTIVFGKAAMAEKWKEFMAKTGRDQEQDTKTMKTYAWMLTAEQKDKLGEVVRALVLAARTRALSKDLALTNGQLALGEKPIAPAEVQSLVGTCGTGLSDCHAVPAAIAPGIPTSASSSSSSLPSKPNPQTAKGQPAGGKKKPHTSDAEQQKEALLAFFKKPKKAS